MTIKSIYSIIFSGVMFLMARRKASSSRAQRIVKGSVITNPSCSRILRASRMGKRLIAISSASLASTIRSPGCRRPFSIALRILHRAISVRVCLLYFLKMDVMENVFRKIFVCFCHIMPVIKPEPSTLFWKKSCLFPGGCCIFKLFFYPGYD